MTLVVKGFLLASCSQTQGIDAVKAGLYTRVVQSLGGWETISMVERYSKSLTFDDALQLYKRVNGSEV